jgi:hypothetical protein
MEDLAYAGFVLAFAVLGALLGLLAHFARANAIVPEDLGLGEPLNSLTRDDYQWEKHVVGAEWDDNGYWDGGSPRNLVYYLVWGFVTPVLIGALLWGQRHDVLSLTCGFLRNAGLHPPLCF